MRVLYHSLAGLQGLFPKYFVIVVGFLSLKNLRVVGLEIMQRLLLRVRAGDVEVMARFHGADEVVSEVAP